MADNWGELRIALAMAGVRIVDPATVAPALAHVHSAPTSDHGSGSDPELDAEGLRLKALVDLATQGDAEAFGQLYDHYVAGIYRFVYYRVGSTQLAEDLTSETFVRGLRAINRFSWQGKDFGAWLTTIARNLITDHYKSSRARLEIVSDAVPESKASPPTPEEEVLTLASNEMLAAAVNDLPDEQRDCVTMRFMQGLSIAQTAAALGRSEGAVKQLQLRAVRRLAKNITADLR